MKYIIRLLLFTAIASLSTTYACNPVYDLCMNTAQNAVDACKNQYASDPVCACSAEKQMLACYSECPHDAQMFETIEKQMAQIAEICGQSGAEAETLLHQNEATENKKSSGGEEQQEEQEQLQSSPKKDEKLQAASIPNPIHKDEVSVLGQTHAKSSSSYGVNENIDTHVSMNDQPSSSVSTVIPFNALIVLVSVIAVFYSIQ